jgi:uracil-DNA glycosylase family 4
MSIYHALSVQSHFSIGKSMLQVGQIASKAKELGYESVALVDDMSIHALVEFCNKCKANDVQPIVGCRLRVYDDAKYRKPSKSSGLKEKANLFFQPKVYLKSEKGLKSLLKLLSDANTKEQYYYHSRTDLDSLLELEDVVVTTGDMHCLFSHPEHVDISKRLHDKFGEDFYVELTPINTPLFDRMNTIAIETIQALKSKSVVTRPVNYLSSDDAETLDLMSAIATNTQLSVSWRPKQYVKSLSFDEPKSILKEMKEAVYRQAKFNGKRNLEVWTSGLGYCAEIAQKAKYTFEKKDVCLPKFGEDEYKLLCEKCVAGWKSRFASPVLGHMPTNVEKATVYKQRLQYELATLKKMGFESYFLLVEDLVKWSKENGVICGPGRGSVGGSLVAYLLGITDVDPIRFGLIFERFINPERLDLPDADLDFASSVRHKVIEYLVEKYGSDYVAGISNYSTLASASALRDAGRISGLSPLDLTATKLVLKDHGATVSLEESAKAVPELEKFKLEHPIIWNHATKLEGVMKSFGQHAAGLIVAGEPIVSRAVLDTHGETPVVNWDKRCVELWGLVKMDLLGLSTLDTLSIACTYIKDRHGVDLRLLDIPLDDPKTLEAFAKGDTTGVFQLESKGMRQLLKNIAKGGSITFDDVCAATALYRPGPMDSGLLDDYVAVRQGLRSVEYDHPNMIEALQDTLGVIIYQEQVMKVAVDYAGFTNAQADKLRKAMGKKNPEEMAKMEELFVKGAVKKSGVGETEAERLFKKIEAFAGYGFNKSHATAYSIISVWCAYIRVHYPAEYFAASLSIVAEDKLAGLVKDARECGIEVLPPDINLSADRFTIPNNSTILAPFNAVKGVSETTAKSIVSLREKHRNLVVVRLKRNAEKTPVYGYDPLAPIKGKFESFEEFELAAGFVGSKVNAKVVANLNQVGAFASVEKDQLPANHVDRRKAQVELMSGLIIDVVKSNRDATDLNEGHVRTQLINLMRDYKSCDGCSLKGQPHPSARCGKVAKFVVVSDCPTWEEEKKDRLMEGDASKFVKNAIKEAGLSPNEAYYTTLVKSKKLDKFLTNEQLNGCRKYIESEMELIKPNVIVALGSASIKHFVSGVKGSVADLVGQAFYDPKRDATIVCGLNAQQCLFDASKYLGLVNTFQKVAEILE